MTVKEICEKYGHTQTSLSRQFGIPLRSIQDWYHEVRRPPDYVLNMIVEILEHKKNGG